MKYPLESSVLEQFSFSVLYSELLENLNEGRKQDWLFKRGLYENSAKFDAGT